VTFNAAKPGAAAGAAPVVLRELKDGVLLVKFNRPERLNASTPEMVRLYTEIMLAAADDPEVRAIVVTGEGRGFCAGVDTAYLATISEGGKARAEKLRRHWFPTEIPKPIIAAINGPCVGLGFVMAMMCDMRFAGESAKVGPGFAKLGLPAENGTAWILPRVVGHARAFEILASGRMYAGNELARTGMVNAVVPDTELMAHTMAFAGSLARECSPRSLAAMKTQLFCGYYTDLREADRLSDVMAGFNLKADDIKEAMRARKEKRAPVFQPLSSCREDWWPAGEKVAGEF